MTLSPFIALCGFLEFKAIVPRSLGKLGSHTGENWMLSLRIQGVLAVVSVGWLVIPASAQTNEMLFKERLISLPVYELLNSRGATTPEQRAQVIAEACRAGLLGPEDCVQRRRSE